MQGHSLPFRVATLVTGLLECLGFAGVLFVFKEQRYFEELCEPDAGSVGYATRLDDSTVLLFLAMPMLAMGGILFLITNLQMRNLFGKHRSTIITMYNSMFDSSLAVFPIIKLLYEQGVTVKASFIFIFVGHTLLLMPRGHIPCPLPPDYRYGFPLEHFGKLFGLVMALSAIVSLLQFPLFTLIKGRLQDDPLYVNLMLVLLALLTFIHPFLVDRECQWKEKPPEVT